MTLGHCAMLGLERAPSSKLAGHVFVIVEVGSRNLFQLLKLTVLLETLITSFVSSRTFKVDRLIEKLQIFIDDLLWTCWSQGRRGGKLYRWRWHESTFNNLVFWGTFAWGNRKGATRSELILPFNSSCFFGFLVLLILSAPSHFIFDGGQK